jgi:uncharacterized integral membrane protein (TIGR00698 family)
VSEGAAAPRSRIEDALLGVPLREAHRLLPGLLLAAAVVVAANLASDRLAAFASSGKSPVPVPTLAVLLGLAVANTVGVAGPLRPGLDFCVKKLLRLGIVLVGLRLSMGDVGRAGGAAIPVVLVLVAAALLLGPRLARALGVSPRLGLLAGASTAICGVTAALAVAPVVEAEDREVAYTVANVTLCGLVGMLLYPFVAHALLGRESFAAGLFLGTSIHDTSQVTGAALAYRDAWHDSVAMDTAIVTKLLRNVTLVAVVPFVGWLHARGAGAGAKRPSLAKLFPLFVLGFLAMAALRTAGDAGVAGAGGRAFGLLDGAAWRDMVDRVSMAGTDGCLAAALASLGLSTRFATLRGLGPRPLLLGVGTALIVATASLGIALGLGRFAG